MPDYRIRIDIKNVARGDVVSLCEDILAKWGDDFDAARGEFVVRTSKREGQSGESYLAFDWEDDDQS